MDKLLNEKGNFRVATHPDNIHLTCWYEAFQAFKSAQSDYNVITKLIGWVVDWEAQAIIDFALTPNKN